ncbi:MAG: hypothetical protein LBF51_07295 [Zoogloeaceae bacterium]|jgi:hypothetical protein|nr:hypothetical protein [Zoogloeaceae bacterium]
MKTIRVNVGRAAAEAFIADLSGLSVKVGWMESAKYPDGTPVALVASVQEYGAAAKGIAPRAFMRRTLAANEDKWGKLVSRQIKKRLENEEPAHLVFDALGLSAQGETHKTLSAMGDYPEDAPVVKRRRSRKKPPPNQSTAILRDTLTLFNTMTYVVEKK